MNKDERGKMSFLIGLSFIKKIFIKFLLIIVLDTKNIIHHIIYNISTIIIISQELSISFFQFRYCTKFIIINY